MEMHGPIWARLLKGKALSTEMGSGIGIKESKQAQPKGGRVEPGWAEPRKKGVEPTTRRSETNKGGPKQLKP